jgi:hypothetical protein
VDAESPNGDVTLRMLIGNVKDFILKDASR